MLPDISNNGFSHDYFKMRKAFFLSDSSLHYSFLPNPREQVKRPLCVTEKRVGGGICLRYRGLKLLQPVFRVRKKWFEKKKNSLTAVPRGRNGLGEMTYGMSIKELSFLIAKVLKIGNLLFLNSHSKNLYGVPPLRLTLH